MKRYVAMEVNASFSKKNFENALYEECWKEFEKSKVIGEEAQAQCKEVTDDEDFGAVGFSSTHFEIGKKFWAGYFFDYLFTTQKEVEEFYTHCKSTFALVKDGKQFDCIVYEIYEIEFTDKTDKNNEYTILDMKCTKKFDYDHFMWLCGYIKERQGG